MQLSATTPNEGPNYRCWARLSSLLQNASATYRTNGLASFQCHSVSPNAIVLTKVAAPAGSTQCRVSFDPVTEVLRVQGPSRWPLWEYTASYQVGTYCPQQFVSGGRSVEAPALADIITNRVL